MIEHRGRVDTSAAVSRHVLRVIGDKALWHNVGMAEEPSKTDGTLARIERHMIRGNEVVAENAHAFGDLRAFLGEQTEVLGALVTEMRAQGEALREFREEMRAHGEEIRAQGEEMRREMAEQRREFREEGEASRREFREEGDRIRREFSEEGDRLRREFHEEMAMARAALVAILDRLQGGGGAAPAT